MASIFDKHQGLRILLLGTPGAGKTWILGALWQAGQLQADVLGGKLASAEGGLTQLCDYVYNGKTYKAPDGQLGAYPATFEPEAGDAIDAVLIDTDGNVTEELFDQTGLVKPKSRFASAVGTADALVFLIDPTKGVTQLEKELKRFCSFVERLEKTRSLRADVAGLPVFLALSKCDSFGKATDSEGDWLKKINGSKRWLDKNLRENLAKFTHPADLAFGKTDVQVRATAVKRPALTDSPRSPEPYGVAELFRDCFEAANDFRIRTRKAGERLQMVVLGFLGLISLMLASGALFFVTRPSAEITMLETAIRDALPGQAGKSSELLKEPLEERLTKLDKILGDHAFVKLPLEKKEEVSKARQEIDQYLEFSRKFQKEVPDPKFAKSEKDLANTEHALDDVKLPAAYDWKNTKLAKKQRQFRQDVENMRVAAAALEAWFTDQKKEGQKLDRDGKKIISDSVKTAREDWLKRLQDFLDRKPISDRDRLVVVKFARSDSTKAPLFTELLNLFGPQPVFIDPKSGEVDWLLERDLAARVQDSDSLNKLIRDKIVELEKTGSKGLEEKFAKARQSLADYSVSVANSPSISCANVNRFSRVEQARKALNDLKDELADVRRLVDRD